MFWSITYFQSGIHNVLCDRLRIKSFSSFLSFSKRLADVTSNAFIIFPLLHTSSSSGAWAWQGLAELPLFEVQGQNLLA